MREQLYNSLINKANRDIESKLRKIIKNIIDPKHYYIIDSDRTTDFEMRTLLGYYKIEIRRIVQQKVFINSISVNTEVLCDELQDLDELRIYYKGLLIKRINCACNFFNK
jgi:hypothetical protein